MNKDFIITEIDKVILVGKYEYPQKKINFGGRLPTTELIYHFNGKSTVYFNGKVLNVRENTIRFLPKGEIEEYVVEKEESGECIDIFFNTNIPPSDEAFVMKINENTNIGNLFKKIFSLWVSKNDGYYFECIALLYKIFAELQKTKYIPKKQYDTIKPAINYIEEKFLEEKISIPDLAKTCGISFAKSFIAVVTRRATQSVSS